MTILITGAGGIVGRGLRRELLLQHNDLRLFGRHEITDLAPGEEAIVGDIVDRSALIEAMRGVSAVIHLAGCTTDAGIEEQISGNIVGAYNIYEAASMRLRGQRAWSGLFSPARIMSSAIIRVGAASTPTLWCGPTAATG
jgi:nucleoside-diphosphate-sugar epimerase